MSGTNWRAHTIENMIQIVMLEDDESMTARAEGWQRLQQLYTKEQEDLNVLRNALADGWDSPGGNAFLEQIDNLVGTMVDAAAAASSNSGALSMLAEKL